MDKNNFIMSYSIDKTFESDKFLKIRCRVCHDEESPNKTYFTKATMEKANKESLEYIPILAHVYVDENGKPVIGSHDMHIEEDKLSAGETRVIYDEQPIGMVPSLADNNCIIEEYNGLNYTFVDAYIWRDYSNYAEQLVEDAENTKMSMEIDFPEDALSYDAANERYNISSYRYRGITLLNETLGTGMKDALVTTTNFSINDDIKSKMIVLMDELQKCLREYDTTNSNKKGVESNMNLDELLEKYELTLDELDFEVDGLSDEELENALSDFACKKKKKCELENHFNSLLKEYGITSEEVDFDYSDMTLEELDAKFEEVFACKKKKKCELDEHFNSLLEQYGVTSDDIDFDYIDMTIEELDAKFEEVFAGCKKKKKKCELEDLVCTFRISHDDTRFALQNLLNAMCDESHFYYIESVYDKYFYYADYFSGDAYKQTYKVRKDVVSFDGDPEPVYREFVTQAERDELETMRKNYAELVAFKENAEAAELKSQKDAIFAKAEYECLSGDADFAKLKDDMDKYSVEEISTKADLIFAAHMKSTMDFSAKDNSENKPKVLGFNFNKKETKSGPYGNLFKKD